MKNLFRFLALAVLACGPELATAQPTYALPRIAPTTGLADSTLFTCVDSTKTLTRACKFSDIQKRLAFKAMDSIITSKLNLTGATITGSPTWSSAFTAASGQRVDSATGAARAQILTTARTIGGTSFNGSANIVPGLADSATGAARAQTLTTARTIGGVSFNGSANIIPDSATGAARSQTLTTPRAINGTSFDGSAAITVTAAAGTLTGATVNSTVTASSLTSFGVGARTDSATGAARSQTLTTARALWGQSFDGSAAITGSLTSVADITGGASSMTVTAGTGNSRSLAVRTTTSGGSAIEAIHFNEKQQVVIPNGAAATPSLVFASDTTTGIYRFGSGILSFSTAGTLRGSISSNGFGLNIGAVTVPNGSAGTPSYGFGSGTGDGMYHVGSDTIGFANGTVRSLSIIGGATTTLIGGAGNMTLLAGSGNSRTMTLQSTTSAGTAKNTLVLGADSSASALGKMAAPGFSLSGAASPGAGFVVNGMYLAGTNPTIARNSTDIMSFNNGVVALGTGVYRSPSGTNNSPTYAFNTSTNAGMYLYAADTVAFGTSSTARLLIANQAATGTGDVSLCVTTTGVTKVITQGAACGTSSAKVKTDIGSIFNPVAKTMALRPSSYSYIPQMYEGRHEYGLIADSVMKVDSTLVFRADHDEKLPNGKRIKRGDALNVNDRAVLAITIATVQELIRQNERQQKTIDSLVAAGKGRGRADETMPFNPTTLKLSATPATGVEILRVNAAKDTVYFEGHSYAKKRP